MRPLRSASRAVVAAVALAAVAPAAAAQCPDGRPMPCATVRPASRVAPPAAAERGRRFLVLPFRNVSRGAEQEWLVEGSTTMIGESLGRWREITVVSDDRLYPALRRQAIVPGSVVEPTRVRRLAEETGGWTAVTGDIVATGGRVRLTARAYDVVTNRDLVRARAEAPAGGDARALFAQVAQQLLRGAGIDGGSADDVTVTTTSLDAYRAYLAAMRYINRAQFRQARSALQEAIRLDSTFAQAHFMLVEAALFADPFAAFTSDGVLQQSLARAVALSDHFAPAERGLVLAVAALFNGSIQVARETFTRYVTRDSTDVRAVAWLAFVEHIDVVLVGPAGAERTRGSVNENIRLTRRVLAIDPARHDAYLPLVAQYLLAAGGFPQVRPGVRREFEGIEALLLSPPARFFVPILRDSIVLVPAESLSFVSRDAFAGARRRALDSATAVSRRWLAEGPTEGMAHYFAAEVALRAGDPEAALRAIERAETHGMEFGGTDVRLLRLNALARLGRYDEARRRAVADDVWTRIRAELGLLAFLEAGETPIWAFNLYLMWGEYGRAGELLDSRIDGLAKLVPMRAMAEAAATQVLGGDKFPPMWLVELPLGFRMDVLDSLLARTPRGTGGPRLESVRARLASLLSRSATAEGVDPVLRARAMRSAWFVP